MSERQTPDLSAVAKRARQEAEAAKRALLILGCLLTGVGFAAAPVPHPSERFGELLFKDDFREGLAQWHVELERPGKVTASLGMLEIDVPGGATLWFRHALEAPVAIEFEATAIKAGGRNDRASDLNCFWMASNSNALEPVFARKRTGRFDQYDDLLGYYVSLGASDNTRSLFLRYDGKPVRRASSSQYELSGTEASLPVNRSQIITLVASGRQIEYWRNGQRLFEYADPQPLRQGWFALRTSQSHFRLSRLRVYRLTAPR